MGLVLLLLPLLLLPLLLERYNASARASLCLIWSQGPYSGTPRTRKV